VSEQEGPSGGKNQTWERMEGKAESLAIPNLLGGLTGIERSRSTAEAVPVRKGKLGGQKKPANARQTGGKASFHHSAADRRESFRIRIKHKVKKIKVKAKRKRRDEECTFPKRSGAREHNTQKKKKGVSVNYGGGSL